MSTDVFKAIEGQRPPESARIKERLLEVLSAEPMLTEHGWVPRERGESYDDFIKRVALDRGKNFNSMAKQFAAALAFCGTIKPTKTIRVAAYSYKLKHVCERYLGTYIANGSFITAAIAAGFNYEREPHSPNCSFNMSARFIKSLEAEAEELRLHRERRRP